MQSSQIPCEHIFANLTSRHLQLQTIRQSDTLICPHTSPPLSLCSYCLFFLESHTYLLIPPCTYTPPVSPPWQPKSYHPSRSTSSIRDWFHPRNSTVFSTWLTAFKTFYYLVIILRLISLSLQSSEK